MKAEEQLLRILKEKELDAVIISNKNNIRYMSGFKGDTGHIYLSAERRILFTDFRYIYQAQDETDGFEIIDITTKGYSVSIKEAADADNCKKVGFESNVVLFTEYAAWHTALGAVDLVPMQNEFDDLRMIKTADELLAIKTAEHIGDLVFTDILEFIKPGVTELEIAARIEFGLKMHGAEGNSFDPIVASGVNSSRPHAVPSRKKIESGDFITMDFGCMYDGFCSDMTRTVVLGKASEKQKEIYNTVLRAQLAVIEQIRPGMTGTEVDAIARNIIYAAGYEGCFGHGLGHGVGLNIHEDPRASLKYDKLILPGMTLTVEPGIYVKDFGGVRIEDLVAITEKGCENYAFSNKELMEL